MTPHPYTEDQLVEQPAIGLFAELGWDMVLAMEQPHGAGRTRHHFLPCSPARST